MAKIINDRYLVKRERYGKRYFTVLYRRKLETVSKTRFLKDPKSRERVSWSRWSFKNSIANAADTVKADIQNYNRPTIKTGRDIVKIGKGNVIVYDNKLSRIRSDTQKISQIQVKKKEFHIVLESSKKIAGRKIVVMSKRLPSGVPKQQIDFETNKLKNKFYGIISEKYDPRFRPEQGYDSDENAARGKFIADKLNIKFKRRYAYFMFNKGDKRLLSVSEKVN